MATKPKRGRGTEKKNLGGRPFLADEDRRDHLIRVLVNETENGELAEAANYVGLPMSTWVRSVALERARALKAEKEAARKRAE
jgi:hypothetical protein